LRAPGPGWRGVGAETPLGSRIRPRRKCPYSGDCLATMDF
jgi:hypothetical protein